MVEGLVEFLDVKEECQIWVERLDENLHQKVGDLFFPTHSNGFVEF